MIKPTKAIRSQEKEALIEFNRQRDKNEEQRIREGKLLKSIYEQRAKDKQVALAGSRINDPLRKEVPPMLGEGVYTVESKKTDNKHDKETDTKVADDVGMKRTT